MSIGSNIKRLRREMNITQEQLAEYLGLSSRSVSQWECERTSPDISQIPALCHIFDVSSDVLLGIDIEKSKETVQKYLAEAQEALHSGDFEKNVQILRKANRQYPRSYEIMDQLADGLVCVISRQGGKDYDEVFALCNRILAECTDSMIRYRATNTLAIAYDYAGKDQEMLKLAEQMPRAHYSYENFMVYRWKGSADFEKRQKYMSYLVCQMIMMISNIASHRGDNGEFMYSPEERTDLYKLEVSLLELIYSDGDYLVDAQLGEIACSRIMTFYLRNQDSEQAWHWLQKGVDFAIHMDTYDFDAPHTSLILRGYVEGGWIMESNGNRTQSILEWLTNDNEAAVFRSDTRYEVLVNRLKKVAKKPEF